MFLCEDGLKSLWGEEWKEPDLDLNPTPKTLRREGGREEPKYASLFA